VMRTEEAVLASGGSGRGEVDRALIGDWAPAGSSSATLWLSHTRAPLPTTLAHSSTQLSSAFNLVFIAKARPSHPSTCFASSTNNLSHRPTGHAALPLTRRNRVEARSDGRPHGLIGPHGLGGGRAERTGCADWPVRDLPLLPHSPAYKHPSPSHYRIHSSTSSTPIPTHHNHHQLS
jgi:hypothetical protein